MKNEKQDRKKLCKDATVSIFFQNILPEQFIDKIVISPYAKRNADAIKSIIQKFNDNIEIEISSLL
ncbi:MAG: hypothetical protein OEV87_04805 [Phycisphaerae bacterium]|nr:hypothetical protein [Phycisphaerae bacterium]